MKTNILYENELISLYFLDRILPTVYKKAVETGDQELINYFNKI